MPLLTTMVTLSGEHLPNLRTPGPHHTWSFSALPASLPTPPPAALISFSWEERVACFPSLSTLTVVTVLTLGLRHPPVPHPQPISPSLLWQRESTQGCTGPMRPSRAHGLRGWCSDKLVRKSRAWQDLWPERRSPLCYRS